MISLITCTLGRKAPLIRLLESLIRMPPDQFELILVDQNEPEYLRSLIAPFAQQITIVHIHTAKGLSLGRNAGLRQAKGTLVAFPDDDCWYPLDTLERVNTLFNKYPELDFVTGRTCDADNKPSLSPSLAFRAAISRQNYLLCGNSNSIFARLRSVKGIGGFDERLGVGAPTPFQSGEESDLVISGIDAQMKLEYFPELVIHHDQVNTANAEDYINRAKKYGAGYGAILRKHHFGLVHFLSRVMRSLARSGLHGFQLQWKDARYKLFWAMGIWSGYWHWPE